MLASIGDFEPSGIVWHSGRGTLVVVGDGGDVAEIEPDGTLVAIWSPGNNWESVTLADPSDSIVYLGSENDSVIYAFDLDRGKLTGDEWDISAYIYLDGPFGFEALTWVPDGYHDYGSTVSGGLFYAGWQLDADIYVFEPDLSTSGTITYLDEIKTTSGYSDLSGLSFCEGTGTIFAVYDGPDRLEEIETSAASPIATYTVPDGGAWEGVVVVDDCPTAETATITFADDAGAVVSYGAMTVTCLTVDADGDGVSRDDDCDDSDASVSVESTFYADDDGDGYGDAATGAASCGADSGYVADNTDCDDGDAAVRPGATEACDAADVDEDCDGLADDRDSAASGTSTWYGDGDGDGYGSSTTTAACDLPAGYAAVSGDCDDGDAAINPAAVEACDAADVDEDCNGVADDADSGATGLGTFYLDLDGDGFGGSTATAACNLPAGYAANVTDCDDTDSDDHPGATEQVGNGDDEDCDGAELCYADGDLDGYRSSATLTSADSDCDDSGEALADVLEDCDDGDGAVHPGAAEVCDAVDDDCDGGVDNDALDASLWAVDGDGDGYTVDTDVIEACDQPAGTAPLTEADCDDDDTTVWPGAPEVAGDGVDQDCDGSDLDDGGPADSGSGDGGSSDGGSDGGGSDDGDGGAAPPADGATGCGCAARPGAGGGPALLVLLAAALRRRRRGA